MRSLRGIAFRRRRGTSRDIRLSTGMSAAYLIATISTAYCLSGTMADGSAVRAGSVAHNGYPLGTRITVSPPFYGRRRFVVRDRIGYGTELDFWVGSCAAARAWGRRSVSVRRGWPVLHFRRGLKPIAIRCVPCR